MTTARDVLRSAMPSPRRFFPGAATGFLRLASQSSYPPATMSTVPEPSSPSVTVTVRSRKSRSWLTRMTVPL